MGDKAHTPTDTYRANIKKARDELVSMDKLEAETKKFVTDVASKAIDAIDDIKKCDTIDAISGLLSVAQLTQTNIATSFIAYINLTPPRKEMNFQLASRLTDIVLWTRNAIIYELHNTCECKDRA